MKNFFKVMAAFAFLLVAAAVVPNTASAAVPSVPSGLHQTDASDRIVRFEWNTIPDVRLYYWSWSVDGVSGWSEGKDCSQSPEGVIDDLNPGSAYYVRVRAAVFAGYDSSKPIYDYSEWSQPLQVVTKPDASQMGELTLTDATNSSLTISWTSCPGATSYTICDYPTEAVLGTVANTSFVRSGLEPKTFYSTKVIPVKTSDTGYTAIGSSRVLSGTYTKPNKPVTPSMANFGISKSFYNTNMVYFGATDPLKSANGSEIEVYTLKGNKKVFTAIGYNNSFSLKRNTTYKYRCRFYATYGNEKIYGDWSGYRYFVFQSVSGKKSGNRIKLGWKKVPNAKSYTVYVSTKEKGGYKKVKTLSKKSTSLTIRKYGKKKINKKKTYYVKVVANLKDGAKSVKSDTYFVGKA